MLRSMHLTADLTTVFAKVALLLSAIGVYRLKVTQVLQSSLACIPSSYRLKRINPAECLRSL